MENMENPEVQPEQKRMKSTVVKYNSDNMPSQERQMKEMEFEEKNPKPSSLKFWFKDLDESHVLSISNLEFTEDLESSLRDFFNMI